MSIIGVIKVSTSRVKMEKRNNIAGSVILYTHHKVVLKKVLLCLSACTSTFIIGTIIGFISIHIHQLSYAFLASLKLSVFRDMFIVEFFLFPISVFATVSLAYSVHSSDNKQYFNAQKIPPVASKPDSIGRQTPPVDDNPDSIGRQTPSVGDNPDSIGRQTPPVDDNPDSIGRQTPPVDDNPDSIGRQTPPVDDNPDSIGRQTPPVDDNSDSIGRQTPSVGDNPDSIGRQTPPVDDNPDSIGRQTPPVDDNPDSIGRQTPPVASKPDSIGRQTPPVASKPDSIGRQTPPVDDKPDSIGRQTPPVASKPDSIGRQTPPVASKPDSIGRQTPPVASKPDSGGVKKFNSSTLREKVTGGYICKTCNGIHANIEICDKEITYKVPTNNSKQKTDVINTNYVTVKKVFRQKMTQVRIDNTVNNKRCTCENCKPLIPVALTVYLNSTTISEESFNKGVLIKLPSEDIGISYYSENVDKRFIILAVKYGMICLSSATKTRPQQYIVEPVLVMTREATYCEYKKLVFSSVLDILVSDHNNIDSIATTFIYNHLLKHHANLTSSLLGGMDSILTIASVCLSSFKNRFVYLCTKGGWYDATEYLELSINDDIALIESLDILCSSKEQMHIIVRELNIQLQLLLSRFSELIISHDVVIVSRGILKKYDDKRFNLLKNIVEVSPGSHNCKLHIHKTLSKTHKRYSSQTYVDFFAKHHYISLYPLSFIDLDDFFNHSFYIYQHVEAFLKLLDSLDLSKSHLVNPSEDGLSVMQGSSYKLFIKCSSYCITILNDKFTLVDHMLYMMSCDDNALHSNEVYIKLFQYVSRKCFDIDEQVIHTDLKKCITLYKDLLVDLHIANSEDSLHNNMAVDFVQHNPVLNCVQDIFCSYAYLFHLLYFEGKVTVVRLSAEV